MSPARRNGAPSWTRGGRRARALAAAGGWLLAILVLLAPSRPVMAEPNSSGGRTDPSHGRRVEKLKKAAAALDETCAALQPLPALGEKLASEDEKKHVESVEKLEQQLVAAARKTIAAQLRALVVRSNAEPARMIAELKKLGDTWKNVTERDARAKLEERIVAIEKQLADTTLKPTDPARRTLAVERRALEAIREPLLEIEREIDALHQKDGKLEGQMTAAVESAQLACMKLCGKDTVGVCELTDPVLANAAALADAASVDAIVAHLSKLEADLAGGPGAGAPKSRAAGAAGGVVAAAAAGAAGLDLTAISVRTAEVALAALAKVIEDRAKRESLVWFLEQMHENVCGEAEAPACAKDETCKQTCQKELDAEATSCAPGIQASRCEVAQNALAACMAKVPALATKVNVRREIRAYWLPNTCALAGRRMDYVQYGGGANLVRALQGAVATDVRRWPGVAAGLGVGAAFWLDTKPKGEVQDLSALFTCGASGTESASSGNDNALCAPTSKLRGSTARLLDDLLAGANAATSFYAYSRDIDRLNRSGTGAGATLHNDRFQMAACLMSLPAVFQEYDETLADAGLDRAGRVQALLLAGLAGSPACWTILGKGVNLDTCLAAPADGAAKACTGPATALTATTEVERLGTLRAWHRRARGPARDLSVRVNELEQAWKGYLDAVKTLKEHGGGAPFAPPPFDPDKIKDATTFAEVLKAFEVYVKDTAREAQRTEQVKLLQASATLAKVSLAFGATLTDALAELTDKGLYPGLCTGSDKSFCEGGDKAKAAFRQTSKMLADYGRHVTTVESALSQDWGAAVAQIVASVRISVEKECKARPECERMTERLSRYSGLFAALVSEKDPEKVAQALDAAALPIGGWRQKRVPGSFLMSISAFPGFGGGFEQRVGQYGVQRERGGTYGVAPTLLMPVGFDFAWGSSPLHLFVSVLDPAAYLQYDVQSGGRLPGAQLISALAPGATLRIAPWDAPLSLNVYHVVRPNFRAWEPQVSGPAATVFQTGVSVSIDVTLFELYTRNPN